MNIGKMDRPLPVQLLEEAGSMSLSAPSLSEHDATPASLLGAISHCRQGEREEQMPCALATVSPLGKFLLMTSAISFAVTESRGPSFAVSEMMSNRRYH